MTDVEKIQELAAIELDEANSKYPQFHSPHEAYGVIKEEVEEAMHEVERLQKHLNQYWHDVKGDIPGEYIIGLMKIDAIEAARELIQVVAMCDKALKMQRNAKE